jgi:hypothetical protein
MLAWEPGCELATFGLQKDEAAAALAFRLALLSVRLWLCQSDEVDSRRLAVEA